MSQKNSTLNFVIRDANGQPLQVKVETGKPIPKLKLNRNQIKLLTLPAQKEIKQANLYKTVRVSTDLTSESKLIPAQTETITSLHTVEPKVEILEVQDQTEDIEVVEELDLDYSPAVSPAESPARPVSSRVDRAPVTVMSYTSRRRHQSDNEAPAEYTSKRRKHADKVGKGLRHFSMKVCEKVRTKGFTSYNEVADELVAEFASGMHSTVDNQQYDQKNIRRRVYDALNVLMAMNIISKEKKEIRWLGLPTNSIEECTALEKEKTTKLDRIRKKTQQLEELIFQHISFKSLIERNKEAENKGVKPSASSAIHLPFIVVNTSDKALIDCSISNDKTEYMFNFNKRFQIHDDIDILKRMGLLYGLDKGDCSKENMEKVKSMLPKSLEHYVEQMGQGISLNISDILNRDEQEECNEEYAEEESEGEAEADDGADPDLTQEYSDDDSSDVFV